MVPIGSHLYMYICVYCTTVYTETYTYTHVYNFNRRIVTYLNRFEYLSNHLPLDFQIQILDPDKKTPDCDATIHVVWYNVRNECIKNQVP